MSVRKLTDEDVRLIRHLDDERKRHLEEANKLNRKEIADKFGISVTVVSNVCTGVAYKEII